MFNKYLIFGLGIMIVACQPPKQQKVITLPYYNQADFTPEWYVSKEISVDQLHQIPSFDLTDQNGATFTEQDVEGKIYVANFFFTICPSVCPRMTNNLQRIQEAFIGDTSVLLVSHSVMPWTDSVAVLKEYASQNEINSDQWKLLTGDKSEIYKLGREAYFADEGFGKSVTEESDFLHTENIVLVDQRRHIRGIYNGTLPLEMARLIEDIEKLKREEV